MLYLLAHSLAFNAHTLSLALHALDLSFRPHAHELSLLVSSVDSSLVLYSVVIHALVSNYVHLQVLKHSLKYHLSELCPLNSSALILQTHFNQHLFLHTQALRKMTIQDLSVLLNLVFVASSYLTHFTS